MIADNLRNPRQVRKIEIFLISSQRMGDLYKLEFPFMGKTLQGLSHNIYFQIHSYQQKGNHIRIDHKFQVLLIM